MRNRFEEQLERLHMELIGMGALCEDAISAAAEALLHGDKALEGNELTGVVVFGTTAGTEASIYAQDNAPQQ